MAEQVSHNVVINSESASASAPADVAANQTNTASAGDGTSTDVTISDDIVTPKRVNDNASDINAATSKADAETEAAASAAEPSAGEAASKAAGASIVPPLKTTEEQSKAGQEELVNGVHDTASQGSGHGEDGSAGSVDHSVTSDNEGSRAGGAEAKKEGNHHVRTNSVKKPTTFSKVSVTKSFLAKSASPAPTSQKSGDKPSPLSTTVQPAAAKPRLVAKTASSLQSIQRPIQGAQGAGGPDARQVWNKNRPAAPPPPKQFTDEELKQQYGIHLATRLQTDEGGKDSKWADIDDDEEDWAPDTVVWMDGTKSTLTPSEATALQKEKEQQQAAAQAPKPMEAPKPTPVAVKPSETGRPKMILKPAAAESKLPNGSAATTPSLEKTSLKAKSPGPSKSPWAALPPVEAVPLVNPPVQQPPPPAALPTQDARAYEQQQSSQPAREIAADTFDRSWREGEGAPRELFNSSNGRYEPAPEGRRTSMRPDSAVRKPLVMQRPSQTGQNFPEPSPAFQTRTGSQSDGASWGRRRGSSVSQGSIPPGRRMSIARPPDLPSAPEGERRQSTVIGHDMRGSPKAQRPSFTQQSPWDQQMPPRPEGGVEATAPAEDPVKAQERIMREKREEARKRRQDEEERLEKEKQERLKARLAALEGVGKSKKEREAEAAAAAQTPTSEKASEPVVPNVKPAERPGAPSKPAEISAEVGPALEAQSLPPAPTQPPPTEEKLPSPLPPQPAQSAGLPERPIASADQAQQASRAHLSPRSGARVPFGQQQPPYRPATSSYSSPGDRKQQPFGRSPLSNNDTLPGLGWNATAPNGNVWGVSGIGNGTFEKTSSFAPVPMSQQNSTLPPPPGMGRPTNSSHVSPQAFGQEGSSPSLHPAEQQRTFPPPGIDSRPEAAWGQSRGSGVSPAPGLGRQAHLPGPIAPPSRAQQQQQPAQRSDAISAWNNAASRLPHQYSAEADAAARKHEEAPTPVPREDTFKETFKQTSASQGKLGGPRRFDKIEHTVHDAEGSRSVPVPSPAPPSTQTQPVGPVPTSSPFQDPWKAVSENTVRIPDGSLNPAHGGLPMQQPPIAPPNVQQPLTAYQGNVNFPTGPLPGVPPSVAKDQSPPPPETASHPVNSGDASHPNIKLPPPPPVVKLPPAPTQVPSQMQQAVMLPHQRPMQVWGPPGVARPIAMNPDWQARFNGLFNRTPVQTEVPPSPPKTPEKMQGPALAVTSSTKALLDELPAKAATVSLPQSPPRRNVTLEGFMIDDSDDVISKPAIDPLFTEELSFGSLPEVRLPRNAMYDPDVYTEPQVNLLRQYANSKMNKPVEPQTQPLFEGPWNKHQAGIFIKIHGTKLQNKLARHPPVAGRKPSTLQDRKPTGKFNKGKDGKDGKANKDSGSDSPSTGGTPNADSRKTSFQKAPVPAAPASLATTSSPAGTAAANQAANGETPKKRSHFKPKGRGAPVKAS